MMISDNLEQFAEDIANSVSASLYRKQALDIHKEIQVKSHRYTVNFQGSEFVRKLGLNLENWTPATVMR